MSWLAAARKRVFEMLASSAALLASASSEFRRVNSSVRSRTRFSSVALARSSASAASKLGVTWDKVVTSPPSGMRLARTSVAAHLNPHITVGQALQIGRALVGVGGQPHLDERVNVAGAGRTDRAEKLE